MTDISSQELEDRAENIINIVLSYLPYSKENYQTELSDYQACVNELRDMLASIVLEDYD